MKHLIGGATELEKRWKDLYSKWPSAYELMPDDFYLNKRPIIYNDGHPILGTDETYLKNGWSLPQNMQANVKKAMEFKKGLGEKLPGNDDNILVIFANTLETLDTIGYSSVGVAIDGNTLLHFTPLLILISMEIRLWLQEVQWVLCQTRLHIRTPSLFLISIQYYPMMMALSRK